MAVKIKVRTNSILTVPAGVSMKYEYRPVSFFLSGGLHAAALFALGLIHGGPLQSPAARRPIYEEFIQPQEHKITWYDFRKPVPEVTAQERIGTSPTPRGAVLSKLAIIAVSPKPVSTKQFIWRPVPKVEIHQDLQAPNVILKAATAIPSPAPPPEPKKIEKPNLDGARAEQPNPSPPVNNGDVNKAQENPVQAVEIPKPRKAFVAPPAAQQEARLPLPVSVSEMPAPDVSITGTSSMRSALPDGLGAPTFSKGAPPPPNATPGTSNNPGNGKVDIAIAGLHPSDKLKGLPEGSRPGQFSQAAALGEPSTGEVTGDGLRVPGLSVHEDRSRIAEPPHVNPNRKAVMYADRVRSISMSTLSVPLRPASRTIPRSIEARFQGRYVYTMVIPIENLQGYSGDWILWFAEHESRPNETTNVRAPVPFRKFETVEPLLPGSRTELRVQVAAMIKKDGKIDSFSILRLMSPTLEQAVLQDLACWEFKPATRDGVAVDVDVVLEIPFSLPPQMAKGTQP